MIFACFFEIIWSLISFVHDYLIFLRRKTVRTAVQQDLPQRRDGNLQNRPDAKGAS